MAPLRCSSDIFKAWRVREIWGSGSVVALAGVSLQSRRRWWHARTISLAPLLFLLLLGLLGSEKTPLPYFLLLLLQSFFLGVDLVLLVVIIDLSPLLAARFASCLASCLRARLTNGSAPTVLSVGWPVRPNLEAREFACGCGAKYASSSYGDGMP